MTTQVADIAQALAVCGKALEREEFKPPPLRELQKKLVNLLCPPAESRFMSLAFIILAWVEKYYANLSGGWPSTISEAVSSIRNRMLKNEVGPALIGLSKALEEDSSVLTEYNKLVTAYLQALSQVAKLAKGGN